MSERNLINDGIVAIYKEEGYSSHDIVNAIRRYTGERRVGHAGTLDPCAKGVMVIGVGRAVTRTLAAIVGKEKEYVVRIKLGWRSASDDLEGRKTQVPVSQIPSEDQVRQALKSFEGIIQQRPPAFSAVKVGGKRAYKLSRAHKSTDLPLRQVETKHIELLAYAWPFVDVRLVTGPGFYVRSLARDLGEMLGTGGYADTLERTRVGPYTKENALRLSDLRRS
ncbi:MAG: tRNA pseudouridine(55) synthase TruB [Planctomycetaceae bacterium]|nr:MAG: tRNA pseudouridine(55) synthase TruB [Planctomycetaceae bacterium]